MTNENNMERVRGTIQDFIKSTIQEGRYDGALVGLSGGIDSATTAYLAVNALGRDKVLGLTLTFPHQRQNDLEDALEIGEALSIKHEQVNLDKIMQDFSNLRDKHGFRVIDSDLELFERINSVISLSMADERDYAILSSTNKTEFLTSFYSIGGNIGHIFPLAELYKTEVRDLARILGVPKKIIEKKSTDGFTIRRSDEEILGISYEDIDKVCYMLESGESPDEIQKRSRINMEIIKDIQKRIKDSERKLSFPTCKVYIPGREKSLPYLPKPKKATRVTRYYGG
ncbi:MAG: NAD(+) synthase [archaeon]